MFDSGIKASDLIEQLSNEVDVSLPISKDTYAAWLSSTEQVLYSAFIKDVRKMIKTPQEPPNALGITKIDLSDSSINPEQDRIRFEDVRAVYYGDLQLLKSTAITASIVPNTWYKSNDDIKDKMLFCHTAEKTKKSITICYTVRPAIKKYSDSGTLDSTVKVPFEFIDLIKSKLRGEAYKLANEDALAAKWLNDYNAYLQDFQIWLKNSEAGFGTYGG